MEEALAVDDLLSGWGLRGTEATADGGIGSWYFDWVKVARTSMCLG